MSKLRKEFTDKEWSECCVCFYKDCKIANDYRKKYGKKEGENKFNKDRKKQK